MNNFLKIAFNSLLLVVLLSVIFLPIGMMSLINYDDSDLVLSAKHERVQPQESQEDFSRPIPKEVEDIILQLEHGYQQSTSSTQPQE